MSLTKHDSIETQRTQLQQYQALITEHTIEHARIGYQLYKNETVQSAFKTLLSMVNSLEDIDIALKNAYKSIPKALHATLLPLPLKNTLLLTRIKTNLLELRSCILIKKPDEDKPPSFDTLQGQVAFCLDAVIFYKEEVFYLHQTTKSLQSITIAKNQRETVNQIRAYCTKTGPMLAGFNQFTFIKTLPGVIVDELPKAVNYIDIIKMIEARLPYLNYKNDTLFQSEIYYALTEAARQLIHNPDEQELVSRFPTIMETFIDQCSNPIVKLSYYHTRILQESENTKPTPTINSKIKEYNKNFGDIYGKVMNEFNQLKRTNTLTVKQKVDHLKANHYAHYIRLTTHVGLQGNKISQALDDYEKNDGNKAYVKKYIHIATIERDAYFSKDAEVFLCQDIQEIINDIHIIYGYFDVTQLICTALTNQINHIRQLWYKLKDVPETSYKEKLYQEACTYWDMCSQYYTCYTLIQNYLTEFDESTQIRPEFDKTMHETHDLFSVFHEDRAIIFAHDTKNDEQTLEQARKNANNLLAMQPQMTKTPKQHKKKIEVVVVENKKSTQKSITQKPQRDIKTINGIDVALEAAQQYISKSNNQEAVAYFWKAYNLATQSGDVIRKLKAMNGLCDIAGNELLKQLKSIELLSKDPHKKNLFQTEAIALLSQLPKLKNTYEDYFQLANTHKNKFTLNEQAGIAFSRDLFWKQFINVQSKLQQLLEQSTKKLQPSQSNKKHNQPQLPKEENLQFVLEKHCDDLASESKFAAQLIDKENQPQQYKITLPPNIQCIFEFLAPFKGTHYLVGSMVLQLLATEYYLLPIAAHDADFISTCNDRASLIIAGFQENYYMRNLYSLYRRFEWSIDLITLPDEENWLQNSLNARDFRVAALSCDKNGTILDPTGKGLDDLKQRRLVMIGNPVQRIKQDPALLLRALKYMVF